jgi:hypothetical protein
VDLKRQVFGGSWARAVVVLGGAVAVLLVLLSPSFGRAEPTGRYRPPLPPDALTNGCYPLPDGLTVDFPYQVRTDEDLAERPVRRLVLQYDRIDAAEAQQRLSEALTRAGFAPSVPSRPGVLRFAKPGTGQVEAVIAPIPRVTADDLVQGTVELILPVAQLQSDSPDCLDPFSTKRFAAAEPTR